MPKWKLLIRGRDRASERNLAPVYNTPTDMKNTKKEKKTHKTEKHEERRKETGRKEGRKDKGRKEENNDKELEVSGRVLHGTLLKPDKGFMFLSLSLPPPPPFLLVGLGIFIVIIGRKKMSLEVLSEKCGKLLSVKTSI